MKSVSDVRLRQRWQWPWIWFRHRLNHQEPTVGSVHQVEFETLSLVPEPVIHDHGGPDMESAMEPRSAGLGRGGLGRGRYLRELDRRHEIRIRRQAEAAMAMAMDLVPTPAQPPGAYS